MAESQTGACGRVNSEKRLSGRRLYCDPNLQIVFSITLMAVLGVASITPAFPRIGQELHLSSQRVGLLITVFTLPGVVLTPVLGVMADRWGRKRVLVPSLLLFGLAGGSCALARDFNLLLGLRFLQGVGAASLGSLNVTLIGDLYTGQQRITAMGYNASVLSVGTASYPAIGGALASLGWRYPFFLPLLALPIGFLVLFGLKNPEPTDRQQLGIYLGQAWKSLKSLRVACAFLAGFVAFVILYGSYMTHLPFLMEGSFAAPPFVIGLMMSGMSLTTALVSSQLGRLARAYTEKAILRIAFAFYALALLLFPLVPRLDLLIVPVILFGIGHGLNVPSIQALIAGMAPMEQRAAFMSLSGMALRLGQTAGPLLMGMVLGFSGVGGVFIAGAALAVAMLVLVSILL